MAKKDKDNIVNESESIENKVKTNNIKIKRELVNRKLKSLGYDRFMEYRSKHIIYDEETIFNVLLIIEDWAHRNPTACAFEEYFDDPKNEPVISYRSFRDTYPLRFESCDKLRADLKAMFARRIAKKALEKTYDSRFAQFELVCNHGGNYRNKIENDITVKSTVTKFKFGNVDEDLEEDKQNGSNE